MLTPYYLKQYIYISFHRVRIKNEPGFLPWFFLPICITGVPSHFNTGIQRKRSAVSYLYTCICHRIFYTGKRALTTILRDVTLPGLYYAAPKSNRCGRASSVSMTVTVIFTTASYMFGICIFRNMAWVTGAITLPYKIENYS